MRCSVCRGDRVEACASLSLPFMRCPNNAPQTLPPSYTTQSGVVLGGTALLSAMNGLTPHMAGAIDIMVVEQPDGSLKCSPFYGASALCRVRPARANFAS